MLSSFVSIRSRCHSNGWKTQFHWWGWDYHRISTVANPEWKGSLGKFFCLDQSEALGEMMGDSIVGDCDWMKCFVSCLGTTGLIWSMNDSQMMCLWLSDVNGETLGTRRSEFVWVGCCVCSGAGDCPSERRATHLLFSIWCIDYFLIKFWIDFSVLFFQSQKNIKQQKNK